MYYIQFYEYQNSQNSTVVECMGSNQVFRLDGRCTLQAMHRTAKARIKQLSNVKPIIGYQIRKGNFSQYCNLTDVICSGRFRRFHEITAWAWKRYCAAVALRIEAAAFHKYMNLQLNSIHNTIMNNGLTAAERTARQTARHAGFYFARSGAVRYMIYKRTGEIYFTAFSFAEMNRKVLAMFR